MNCTKIVKIAGIVLVSLAVSGCSVDRISLAETGKVSIEKQDSRDVKILWADVYQQDGQKWVYAVLKQQGNHPFAIKTHVDIQVLSEDGTVQYETISEDMYVPRIRKGKGTDWKRFNVKLATDISTGSKVNIKIHSGKHDS